MTPLMIAIFQECLESVKVLVANKADVNARVKKKRINSENWDGGTPLLFATKKKNVEIARHLIENGANVDASKDNLATPLICAAFDDDTPMIELLLDHGAKINFASDQSPCCKPPLLMACEEGNLDSVEILLKRGAFPDVEHRRQTPLFFAVARGHHRMISLLLSHGANVNKTNQDGISAIQVASVGIMPCEMLKVLLDAGANPNVLDQAQAFPLFMLSQNGKLNGIRLLVERGADVNFQDQLGNASLLPACFIGSIEIVKYLIEKGADINHANQKDEFPIHAACNCEVPEDSFEVTSFLLSQGANPNVLNQEEGSPLHIASKEGQRNLVEKLLEFHASVSIKNSLDQTPIDVAQDPKIRKLLEEYCAEIKPAKREENK
mmetsp:Transcript_17121/g.23736  ORF Transcript_17121/g.23736 Transcript_17121/m.23736 type:complete len:379 (+) Transcript_17121:518-1654(+)